MPVKLDTKHANGFIKEYNDLLPMKKYSKMTVGQKNELIRKKMNTLRNNKLAKDLESLEKSQQTKDSKLKTAVAQQGLPRAGVKRRTTAAVAKTYGSSSSSSC